MNWIAVAQDSNFDSLHCRFIQRSRWFMFLCITCGASIVHAEEHAYPVWLNPGIYSYHFDPDKNLRNENFGFGAEIMLEPNHVVMAGTYANSNDARTRYVAYAWRPLRWQISGLDVGLGALLGAFDGYPNYRDGGWFVAPLPLFSVEGKTLGANITLIPTVANRFDGAVSIQVKLRVW